MGGNLKRQREQRFTLERAVMLALVLHLVFGGLVTWWPGLLFPAEPALAADPRPLEFTFVDTPDPEQPVETPTTDVMSDVDRRAADASPRDSQPTPMSEGNTPQMVVRPPQSPQQAATAEPSIETPPVEASEPEPQPAEATETERPPGETGERANTQPTNEAAAGSRPIPPARTNLRNSLAQLESVVEPQVFDNRSGGVDGPRSLAQFDTRGYDLGAYMRKVLATIERNWRANIPPLIRTGVGGATFVSLSIRRQLQPDGTEIAIIVAERTWSSGQPAYDSAALFSLELSTPLPAIPGFYPFETIEGRLGYIYNLDPSEIVFPDQ